MIERRGFLVLLAGSFVAGALGANVAEARPVEPAPTPTSSKLAKNAGEAGIGAPTEMQRVVIVRRRRRVFVVRRRRVFVRRRVIVVRRRRWRRW